MGEVGNFFLGGSKNKTKSEQESQSVANATSQQSSENASAQGALSSSNNNSFASGTGYNAAYAPIAQAMSPTLGMTAAGGNMLGALLGVPGYTINGGPNVTYPTTAPPVAPGGPAAPATPSSTDLLAALEAALTPPAPPPSTIPPVVPPVVPPGTPPPVVPPPASGGPPVLPAGPPVGTPYPQTAAPFGQEPRTGGYGQPIIRPMAKGGSVQAGQPLLVGENRPELFVPKEDGMIIPQVPQDGQMYASSMGGTASAGPPRVPTPSMGGGGMPGGISLGGFPATPPALPGVPTASPRGPNLGPPRFANDPLYQEYAASMGADFDPRAFRQDYREARRDWREGRPDRDDYEDDRGAYRDARDDWRETKPTLQTFLQSLLNPPPAPEPVPAPVPGIPPVPTTPIPAPMPPIPPIPGRAFGGPVTAGQPYTVGEKRPEMFVPTTPTSPAATPNLAKTAGPKPSYPGLAGASPFSLSSVMPLPTTGAGAGWGSNLGGNSGMSGRGQGLMDAARTWIDGRPQDMSDQALRDQWLASRPDFQSMLFNPPVPAATPAPLPNDFEGQFPTAPGTIGIGKPLPPGRAFGGPVRAGSAYTVGENRPEMFVPTGPTAGGDMMYANDARGGRVPRSPRAGNWNPLAPPTVRPWVPGAPGSPGAPPTGTPPILPPGAPGAPPPAGGSPQQQAMENWADSAGYQYMLKSGQDAVNSNNSANGFLQSGATGTALTKLGVQLANTYQNDYTRNLLEFAKLGLGGASAMSGAGGINTSGSGSSGAANSASLGGSASSSQGSSNSSSSGSSSGSSSESGNSKNGLIPALSQAVSAYKAPSDRRLKTNITKVGELSDGLGVYDFDYRRDIDPSLPSDRMRGVMADEVKELRPQAYIADLSNGYAGVDYGAL